MIATGTGLSIPIGDMLHGKEATFMLWTILLILLILWAIGFAFDVAGGLVHVLLVIALIVLIYRLVTGRKVP
ncbi:hypothetical protein CIL03_12275 [Virgibacillus indicus]|uniref:Lmo0937 family membrane protein n=1 Tax=Virgibacillus indicus TaxID=2024554 RepID=A0A265NAU7_9BACI|nr:hypothetical protein CIL03_12275 [Virgibacillus indicus]